MSTQPIGHVAMLTERRERAISGLSPMARHHAFPHIYRRPLAVGDGPKTKAVPVTDSTEKLVRRSYVPKPSNDHPAHMNTKAVDLRIASLVIKATSEAYCVTFEGLISPHRCRVIAWPRFAAMRLLKERDTECSLAQVGRFFRRDHTSVMHGLWRAAELHANDAGWRLKYDRACSLYESFE